MTDTEVKAQVVLLAVHAAAFLILAGWLLLHRSRARWAKLAVGGSALLGLSFGILAASSLETVFLDSFEIAEALMTREHSYTVLVTAQAVGAVLLVLAIIESRRTPPTGTGSIYGP